MLLVGCSQTSTLKPLDTKLNIKNVNWERLYAKELSNSLKHEDDLSFHFFWPLYLEARHEEKFKKLDKSGDIE